MLLCQCTAFQGAVAHVWKSSCASALTQGKKSSVNRWVKLHRNLQPMTKATLQATWPLNAGCNASARDCPQANQRLPSSYVLDNPYFSGDKTQRLCDSFCSKLLELLACELEARALMFDICFESRACRGMLAKKDR